MATGPIRTMHPALEATDLGRMAYAEALDRQRSEHERVLASREDGSGPVGSILVVEHDPVLTVSKRPTARRNIVAAPERLAAMGIEVCETDRGGDITYHGPGQLVAYPIVDLNRVGLNLHAYMRLLEDAVIATCSGYGVEAGREEGATGVWVPSAGVPGGTAKICAMGVRVRRWVTMHGLALNVRTNLEHFSTIVPCGLTGRAVTSMEAQLGGRCPEWNAVRDRLVEELVGRLGEAIDSGTPRKPGA